MLERIIVRDYNGHYRMDQVDLDDCRRLDRLRAENGQLRERVRELEQACDNYDQANCEISRELNETRWQLRKAREQIEKMENVEVSYEVIKE